MSTTSTTRLTAVTQAFSPTEKSLDQCIKPIKCIYTWTIENFSRSCEETGKCVESPTFEVREANDEMVLKCAISVLLKGSRAANSKYLSPFLQIVLFGPAKFNRAEIEFSLLNIKGSKENSQTSIVFLQNIVQRVHMIGIQKFMMLQSLLDQAKNLLPEDKLTVRCELTLNVETGNIHKVGPTKAPKRRVPDDLCKLFDDMTLSDVTLVADGREIQAHKVILAARSPVFAAMFQHRMEEQKSNQVHITDISHDALTEFLRFMYTDQAQNLERIAGDLLAAADKYALDSLKVLCEEALHKRISVETAAETLVLADRHSAEWLKAKTIAFINTPCHASEVMETESWQSMVPAHPHLVAEVLKALAIQQQRYLT